MNASSRSFSWSMELLAFASCVFAPKMLDNLLTTHVCHSNPFFVLSERSGRKGGTARYAKRLVYKYTLARRAAAYSIIIMYQVQVLCCETAHGV